MDEQIKIYFANIKNKTIEMILKDYKDYIKDQDIQKMERFKFDLNKKQSIISSILKNKYVGNDIYINKQGKPMHKDIFFNISHSDDYVVIALNDKYDIGIDIEHIKENINDELINHVCNDLEIKEINNGDKNKLFYYYWTRKEATLKCKGSGLVNDVKDILKNNNYTLESFFIDDYVCSIAINYKQNIKIAKEWEYE